MIISQLFTINDILAPTASRQLPAASYSGIFRQLPVASCQQH